VPLPFVGHQHASGVILGVALVLPHTTAGSNDRRGVYNAVARWEQKYRQEDEDTPSVQLTLGAAGVLCLERVEWGSVQASLKSTTWSGPAVGWDSVTPVALDRNPGDLRSRDPVALARATDEAIEVVCRACERIDLPRPRYVEILPAAPWAGASKARNYPPYPGDARRTQRVLTHVRLEFERPVEGPILLGAGRYLGLGLFRPEDRR
jgi:CRISPR-associated protein Csb2